MGFNNRSALLELSKTNIDYKIEIDESIKYFPTAEIEEERIWCEYIPAYKGIIYLKEKKEKPIFCFFSKSVRLIKKIENELLSLVKKELFYNEGCIYFGLDIFDIVCNLARAKIKRVLSENHKNALRLGKENYDKNKIIYKDAQKIKKEVGTKYIDILHTSLYEIEEVRRNLYDRKYLEVRCKYCNKWFIPKKIQVKNRLKYINGETLNESLFYCSIECKKLCPLYNAKKYSNNSKLEELDQYIRKVVFERDGFECVKCGETINLHCHHIDPRVNNKFEINDIDNCMTVCNNCHFEIHSTIHCKNIIKCARNMKNRLEGG